MSSRIFSREGKKASLNLEGRRRKNLVKKEMLLKKKHPGLAEALGKTLFPSTPLTQV